MSLAYSGGRETTSMTSPGGRILMKRIVRLLQQQLLVVVLVIFLTVETRRVTGSRFCQRPALPGYGCSEHTVQTDDGYLLVLHRLSLIKISRSAPASTASSMTTPTTSDAAASNVTRSAAGTTVERPNVAETENRTATLYLRNTLVPRRRQEPIITSGVASESATNKNASGTPSLPGAAALAPTSILGNPAISGRNNSRKSAAPDCPSPGSTIPNVPPTVPNVPTRRRPPGIGAPVLLMHQEFQNGDIWLRHVDERNRTDQLLPVMLLENGFDVWVGHQRATLWGNGHVNLTHTQQAYWDWTWDQHAQYDLPAQLLFINNVTHKRIHYIGVSQAATVGAAGATVERTSSLLKSLTVIGLTAYRGYTDSRLLNAWAYYFGRSLDTEYYATGFQNGAFNYSAEFSPRPVNRASPPGTGFNLISGPNCCLGPGVVDYSNGWDGTTSFKNLLQWQQEYNTFSQYDLCILPHVMHNIPGIRTDRWAKFDYSDYIRNRLAYGVWTPPSYIPELIPPTLPVFVIYGGQDWTAPARGVRTFIARLRQPPTVLFMPRYAHDDLTYSVTREADLFQPILSFLEANH